MSLLDNNYCINFDTILQAQKRIQIFTNHTPVLTSSSINGLLSNHSRLFTSSSRCDHQQQQQQPSKREHQQRFFFKVEAMQHTGSFKFRGALNAILSIVGHHTCQQQQPQEILENTKEHEYNHYTVEKESLNIITIVTHSSGNHAAAIACGAEIASSIITTNTSSSSISVKSTIVMPRNVTAIKKRAVEEYHGEIILVDNTNEARESMATQITQERTGAYFVHPSEDPRVIAGQGTVCLEFVAQVRDMFMTELSDDDLDCVIIPVGGGGLAAGNTIALRALLGNYVKIILAEPELMNDAKRSKVAGTLLEHDKDNPLNSVADGLKTTLGPNTWPIVRDLVDDVITVSERDILAATKLIWERLKVCIEPSAGVGVAVAMSQEFHEKYIDAKNVGIILCGGNVDIIKFTDALKNIGLS